MILQLVSHYLLYKGLIIAQYLLYVTIYVYTSDWVNIRRYSYCLAGMIILMSKILQIHPVCDICYLNICECVVELLEEYLTKIQQLSKMFAILENSTKSVPHT